MVEAPVLWFTEGGGGPDTFTLSVVDMDDPEMMSGARNVGLRVRRAPSTFRVTGMGEGGFYLDEESAEKLRDGLTAWLGKTEAPRNNRATAFADVAAERDRQISKHGHDESHDDAHDTGAIGYAAIAFAAAALGEVRLATEIYPWGVGFDPHGDDKRTLMVKAAALAIAEIERIDRATEKEKTR